MRVKKKMNNLLGQIKMAAYNDELEKIAASSIFQELGALGKFKLKNAAGILADGVKSRNIPGLIAEKMKGVADTANNLHRAGLSKVRIMSANTPGTSAYKMHNEVLEAEKLLNNTSDKYTDLLAQVKNSNRSNAFKNRRYDRLYNVKSGRNEQAYQNLTDKSNKFLDHANGKG